MSRIFGASTGKHTSTHDGPADPLVELERSDGRTVLAPGTTHAQTNLLLTTRPDRSISVHEFMGVHQVDFSGADYEILID